MTREYAPFSKNDWLTIITEYLQCLEKTLKLLATASEFEAFCQLSSIITNESFGMEDQ